MKVVKAAALDVSARAMARNPLSPDEILTGFYRPTRAPAATEPGAPAEPAGAVPISQQPMGPMGVQATAAQRPLGMPSSPAPQPALHEPYGGPYYQTPAHNGGAGFAEAPAYAAQRAEAPSVDSAQRSAAPFVDSAQRSGAPFVDSAQRSAAPFSEHMEPRHLEAEHRSSMSPAAAPFVDSAQRSTGFVDSAQRSGAPFVDSAQRSGAPFVDSAQRSGAPFVDPMTMENQSGGQPVQSGKKPKPTHYKIVCISLYIEDIARLDDLVAELKRRGHTKANKSQVIRAALEQIDLNKVPKAP